MRISIVVISVIFLLLSASAARADQDPSLPDATPIRKGQPAPADGIFLSPTGAAKIVAQISFYPKRIEEAVATARLDQKIHDDKELADVIVAADRDKEILQAQLDASKTRESVLLKRIDTLEKETTSSFWKEIPWLVGGVGLGIMSTLLVVTIVK